jgi:RNA polymerase sigma-70 factor, ECF subfamily
MDSIKIDTGAKRLRQWGRKMEDWRVGNTDAVSRTIRLVSPNNPGGQHNYNSIIKVALHEVIHKLTSPRQEDLAASPQWLLEGVACYYSGQLDNYRGLLPELVKTNRNLQIEDLDWEGFSTHNGYPFSAALIEYIVRVYGEEKLRRLLKSPHNLEKEFAISMTELNKNWQADLVKSYP